MLMKNKIIIFDIDATITKKNLHELVISEWIGKSLFRKCLIKITYLATQKIVLWPLKRRLEYLPLLFVNEIYIKKIVPSILNNPEMVHSKVIKRIEAYKKIGYKVIFITAAPQKTSSICAQYFQVDFESSKTKFGFITRDLLAKKIKIYKNLIANNYEICAIYSDSKLDLSKYAKKNILINSDGVGKVHRL